MKKYESFLSEFFQFLEAKFSIYLNRRVFVMCFSFLQIKILTKISKGNLKLSMHI